MPRSIPPGDGVIPRAPTPDSSTFLLVLPDGSVRIFNQGSLLAAQVLLEFPGLELLCCAKDCPHPPLPFSALLVPGTTYYLSAPPSLAPLDLRHREFAKNSPGMTSAQLLSHIEGPASGLPSVSAGSFPSRRRSRSSSWTSQSFRAWDAVEDGTSAEAGAVSLPSHLHAEGGYAAVAEHGPDDEEDGVLDIDTARQLSMTWANEQHWNHGGYSGQAALSSQSMEGTGPHCREAQGRVQTHLPWSGPTAFPGAKRPPATRAGSGALASQRSYTHLEKSGHCTCGWVKSMPAGEADRKGNSPPNDTLLPLAGIGAGSRSPGTQAEHRHSSGWAGTGKDEACTDWLEETIESITILHDTLHLDSGSYSINDTKKEPCRSRKNPPGAFMRRIFCKGQGSAKEQTLQNEKKITRGLTS